MPEIETSLMTAANAAAEFLKDLLPMAIRRKNVSVLVHGEEAIVYMDSGIPMSALRVRIGQDGAPDYTVLDFAWFPTSPVYSDLAKASAETAIGMTDTYMEVTNRIERLRRVDEERIIPVAPFAHNDDEPPEPSRSLVDAAYHAAEFLNDVLPTAIRWPNIRVRMFATEGYVYLDVNMELAALRVRIGPDSPDYTVTDNEKVPLSPVYSDLARAVAEVAIEITNGYTEISWRRHLERRAARNEVPVLSKTGIEEDTGFDMNF